MKLVSKILICCIGILALGNTQHTRNYISGKVRFTIKNMGFGVDGTMELKELQFLQPSADPSGWKLQGSASPATISTGINIRDKHLKRSDYFDIEKYPFIDLQSSRIISKGKNKYEGTFTLTMKGISKTVNIPFTILKNGNENLVEGKFSINRLDYGIGEESAILANPVQVKVSGVFKNP